MTSTQKEPDRVRPFADFLQEQAKGRSHTELSEALQTLVNKVTDTGKKGSLIYKVIVEPMKGDTGVLAVTDDIDLRLPQHDRSGSLFFADRDGNLVRNDPNQAEFKLLRDASGVYLSTDEEVDQTTGEISKKGAGA